MKKSSIYLSALALSLTLAACQDTNEGANETSASADESTSSEEQEAVEVDITGLGDHYHTGDTVELGTIVSGTNELDHWHWYTRESDQDDWEVASGQEGDTFSMEAADGLEIKAVLYDDDHEVAAESEPATVVIDDHHGHDEESKLIYQGYFDDEQVADRELSDWEGDWQSVYPYLQNGDLDDVFAHKAEEGDMTAEEYKDYYTTGYETDVERITIEDGHVTFYENNQEYSGDYAYDGYEILTYEKGNRGVRFIYSLTEEAENMPQYIQFSDHIIAPQESSHFHLYWGDDREELLDEVEHWPTYYPSSLDADGIVRDQLAH